MRANGKTANSDRCKRLARAVAVACAVAASTLTSGCAHVGAIFDSPEEAGQRPAVRKSAMPKPKVVVTPAMRAEAEVLRAAAFEQMSRGAVGPAVTNLTKASKLDPTNEKIRIDLDRAIRVRNAVATKAGSPSSTAALD